MKFFSPSDIYFTFEHTALYLIVNLNSIKVVSFHVFTRVIPSLKDQSNLFISETIPVDFRTKWCEGFINRAKMLAVFTNFLIINIIIMRIVLVINKIILYSQDLSTNY